MSNNEFENLQNMMDMRWVHFDIVLVHRLGETWSMSSGQLGLPIYENVELKNQNQGTGPNSSWTNQTMEKWSQEETDGPYVAHGETSSF